MTPVRPRPVLVAAPLGDQTADAVIDELTKRDVPVARFDPGADFPHALTLAARINGTETGSETAEGPVHGTLATPSRRVRLADVRSVFHRHHADYGAAFEHLAPQDAVFATAQARHGLGGVLAALPCLQVNHPHAATAASYKAHALAVAVRSGFRVPPTLITSDPDEARAFARACGPVVYKVLRVARYLAPDGQPLTIWTIAVTPDDIDDSVAGTAHMFQARVPSVADARVTAVGTRRGMRLFAARIASGLLDWRTDYDRHTTDVIDVPAPIAASITDYMRELQLVYAAFDFGLTGPAESPAAWRFYEANPGGQYGWIEAATGLPITAALADLLENGNTP